MAAQSFPAGARRNRHRHPAFPRAWAFLFLTLLASLGALAGLKIDPKNIPPPPPPAPAPAPARQAGKDTNSLGMKFVTIDKVDYCIWLTRVKDYETYAKESVVLDKMWHAPGFKQGPDHPVVYVSWQDAMAFCQWLTEREHNAIQSQNPARRLLVQWRAEAIAPLLLPRQRESRYAYG